MASARPAAALLDAVVAASRQRVATRRDRVPQAALERQAARRPPAGAVFREALAPATGVAVIAECKRRSPSKGVLCRDYEPARVARAYERGGAAAVSVLTEPTFFDGALDHLVAVRAAVGIPVLRKDFIVDDYQLWEAAAAGADAVLLIVAALDRTVLAHLLASAASLGLAALVEAHTADEIDRAVAAGATIVGVNSRDLRTLTVDAGACDALAGCIPPGTVAVAESGIASVDGVRHLHGLGYQAVLIGEWLMHATDPASLLGEVRRATGRAPGQQPGALP